MQSARCPRALPGCWNGRNVLEVDHIVCHQANHRIVEGIARHLRTYFSCFYENIEFYGNTSAASIPIALCEMQEQDLLCRGERMVLVASAAG